MKFRVLSSLSLCLAIAVAAPAWAHHSFSQYDGSKKVVLNGTVLSYQWSNPHVWIQLAVPDAQGVMKEYSVECPAIVGLSRMGWNAKTLRRGDRITVTMHPTRTSSLGGALYEVTLANGTKLGQTQIQRNRYTSAIGAPEQTQQAK